MNANLDANEVAAKGQPPRLALLFATVFGLGYLPLAPGTWGSLAGVALAYPFLRVQHPLDLPLYETYFVVVGRQFLVPLTIFISLAGVWTAGRVARYLSTHDPQIVVIDEVSGQMLTLLLGGAMIAGSANWKYYLLGFILFRVFDIWKPFPANRAEALPGGWGIMADDWVAGLYAAACLWLARGIGV